MTSSAAADRQDAALALHRFGLGPVHDSITTIAADPRGALLAELDRPGAGRVALDLPSSGKAARAVFQFHTEQRAKQKLAQRARKTVDASGMARSALGEKEAVAEAPPPETKELPLPQRLLQAEAKARFDVAATAEIGFVERLVWFWSNHFCISADKIIAMVGPYEREAIRPHVLGRFADLLLAAESHPAMLFYLDNVQSMGTNSIAGIDRDKGLNENLAREILELHTLGVRGGYSQADVTNFAKVLTGWSWLPPAEPAHGGEFVFNPMLHEPGGQIVLGRRYDQSGMDQGRAVLADLARHPATAQHIAEKLARHFVADEPPAGLVAKLTTSFKESDGDLKHVARTLVSADESWTTVRQKLKPPAEWVAGALRLTGTQDRVPIGRILVAQATLGAPLWRPPAPNGFPDTESAWIDGVSRRLNIANEFAGRAAAADPLDLLESSVGPLASSATRETVARAESRKQALALLLMTPEFLRR